MGFTNKVIFWIIPLIVLVVLIVAFFADESLFEDIKIATEDIQELPYIPEVDVGVGAEIRGDDAPTIRREQMDAIDKLSEKIQAMKGKEKCFANYEGLPPLNDISVVFEEGVDKYRMIIKGGEHLTREVKVYDLGNIKPCVIAGKTPSRFDVAEMFFQNFLKVPPTQGGDFYKPVTSLSFSYDGENKIHHDFGNNDIEDSGWLFTPDGVHMCFFPTNDHINYNKDGLEHDLVAKLNDLVGNKLNSCTQESSENKIKIIYTTDGNPDHKAIFNFFYNTVSNKWAVDDHYQGLTTEIMASLQSKNEEEGLALFQEFKVPSPGQVLQIEGISAAKPQELYLLFNPSLGKTVYIHTIYDRHHNKWLYAKIDRTKTSWSDVTHGTTNSRSGNVFIASLGGKNEQEGIDIFNSFTHDYLEWKTMDSEEAKLRLGNE